MHILLGVVLVIAVTAFLMSRRGKPRPQAKATRSLPNVGASTAKAASRLAEVRDPKLAAAVLMIQLVRTGAPVTSAEKAAILDLLETRLKVKQPEKMYDEAWAYTENRAFFSLMSDQLLPLLKDRLGGEERLQLIDMLQQTASAYNGASELQQSSISRLKKRLMDA